MHRAPLVAMPYDEELADRVREMDGWPRVDAEAVETDGGVPEATPHRLPGEPTMRR